MKHRNRNLCNFNLHGLDLPTLPTPPALSAIEQPKSPRLKFKRALHPPLCIKIFVPGFIRKKQTCAHISAPPIFATKAGEKPRFPNAMLCPSLDQKYFTCSKCFGLVEALWIKQAPAKTQVHCHKYHVASSVLWWIYGK